MQAIYSARRQKPLENKPANSMVVIFSGRAPMKSLDEAYPFDVDRNFFYLTGIERENMILVMRKDYLGHYSESLYIEPYDEWLAKWVGGRMRNAEATAISGIQNVDSIETFPDRLNSIIESSRGLGKLNVYLDLWRYHKDQVDTPAHTLAATLQSRYPAVGIEEINGDMAAMRAVKDEYEIKNMRQAQEHTRIAIEDLIANIAAEYYAGKSRDIDIIKLNGSIELAPILGLSDVIVDIVETGTTLRENHLAVLETVLPISARLIANEVSFKFKTEEIEMLTKRVKEQVETK